MSTTIGLMPYKIAKKYDISVSRKVVYASSWLGWFASPYRETILLNINNSSTGEFASNASTFAGKALKIANTLKPEVVVIENEPQLHGDIKTYCAQLTATVNLLSGYMHVVTNGGLTTLELGCWYWNETKDDEFFQNNIPTNQEAALLDGSKAETIERVAYELAVLKTTPVAYVNIHFYFGYAGQVPGLIRMINYVKQFTGKPIISNEAGIYDEGLLPACVDIARQCGMQYLILYSGTGGDGKALPITKAEFQSVIL